MRTWSVLLAAFTLFLAGCDQPLDEPAPGSSPFLERLELVLDSSQTLSLGNNYPVSVTGHFSDGSQHDVTNEIEWQSSHPNAIAIDLSGTQPILKAATVGALITITASHPASGTATSAILSVEGISLELPQLALAAGTEMSASLIRLFGSGDTVETLSGIIWSSSDPSVLAVSSNGVITAVSAGEATITAELDGHVASHTITVSNATLSSIVVQPANHTTNLGLSVQYSAIAIFSDDNIQDISQQVTWASSDSNITTITNTGLVAASGIGSALITASFNTVNGSTSVTVGNASLTNLSMEPAAATTPAGLDTQFNVIGHYSDGTTQRLSEQASWSSSDTNTATILDFSGLSSSLATGSTTITASIGGLSVSGILNVTTATLTSITLEPQASTVAAGLSRQLSAIGHYSDGTTRDITHEVSWGSSDDTIATISNLDLTKGKVITSTSGSVTITATAAGGTTSSAVLDVTAPTLDSISIDAPHTSMASGSAMTLSVNGHFSDNSTQSLSGLALLQTSNPAIASISNLPDSWGRVTAHAAGNIQLYAGYGSHEILFDLSVTPAALNQISISPANLTIASGLSLDLTATGSYADATTQDLSDQVSWISADPNIVQIDSQGRLYALNTGGPVAIRAEHPDLACDTNTACQTQITVTAATLTSIDINPAGPLALFAGDRRQLTATGNYSDLTTVDLTQQLTWESSNPTVTTVSNLKKGLIEIPSLPSATGTATITTSLPGSQATATLTINASYDPGRPHSISFINSTNALFNNDVDTIQVNTQLLGVDGNPVADGTEVTVSFLLGSGTLISPTAVTTNGIASFNLRSTYQGTIILLATETVTGINSIFFIQSTNDFATLIVRSGIFDGTKTNNIVQDGSLFYSSVRNRTNRTFNLNRYSLSNGGTELWADSSATNLNGNLLPGGITLTITDQFFTQTIDDNIDNGFAVTYELSDTNSGQTFNVVIPYVIP